MQTLFCVLSIVLGRHLTGMNYFMFRRWIWAKRQLCGGRCLGNEFALMLDCLWVKVGMDFINLADMKRSLYVVPLLFLLLGPLLMRGQGCQLPSEVHLSDDVRPNGGFPIEADGFFPIGWSKDGKFAWLLRRNHDPLGEYLGFYIQDMITDRMLVKWEHDTFEQDFADPLAKGWEVQGDEICRQLKEHGIVWGDKFDLRRGQGYRFGSIDMKHLLRQKEGPESNELLKSASLYLDKRGAGRKQIFHLKGEAAENSLIKSLKVLGIAKSPFEQRVVVVLQADKVGFEGYTDRTYLMIGASLVKGFR